MSNAAFSIDSNVTIRIKNEYGKVTRTSKIHNKATSTMVEGLLRFLTGDFNTNANNTSSDSTNDDAHKYIPAKIRFGNVGVKLTNRETTKPVLSQINSGEYKQPTFKDIKLQSDCSKLYEQIRNEEIKFDTVEMTPFDDNNNSMGLLFQTFIPIGKLVGFGAGSNRKYYTDTTIQELATSLDSEDLLGWVFYSKANQEYQALFTEIGLYNDEDTLLARVLFDGTTTAVDGEVVFDDDNADNNPILQSDTSSVVIEWRVGIVSLGENDKVVSAANPIPSGSALGESEVSYVVETVNSSDIIASSGTSVIGTNQPQNIDLVNEVLEPTAINSDMFVIDDATQTDFVLSYQADSIYRVAVNGVATTNYTYSKTNKTVTVNDTLEVGNILVIKYLGNFTEE